MNLLELRKIIQIGYRFAEPEVLPILDREGMPLEPVKVPYTATIAFWIPCPKPHQRSSGATKVPGALPFEIRALMDGAIEEHVQDFEFPEQPSGEYLKKRLMVVWEGLTAQSLGVAFNSVPLDSSTKPIFQFESVPKETPPDGQSPISLH